MRRPERAVDELDVSRFADLIQTRTGMAFGPSRLPNLKRAVRRSTAQTGVDLGTLNRLLSGKGRSGAAFDALISALNVGETYFFRDSGQMQSLEQQILPELIARRSDQRRLRIWSAGCSTGEEAYTLAILVDRLLPARASWNVLILATDVNGGALLRARRGVYGRWSLRGNDELARPYLTPRDGHFEVAPSIRAMVTFGQLNLVEDGYPAPSSNTHAMDLVLCRNVLLYFDPVAARSVARRLSDALLDGGWLLVSRVEAGLGIFDRLREEGPGTGVYRKMGPIRPEPGTTRGEPPDASSVAGRGQNDRRPPRPHPSHGTLTPAPVGAPAAPRWPSAYEAALRLWDAARGQDALRLLETEVDGDPMAAPLHYLCGLILLGMERTEEALAALRRCTCADPGFVPGHLAQAGLFVRVGSRDRAAIALETTARLVAGLQPDDLVFEPDDLTARDVLDLVTTHRELLGSGRPSGVRHG